MGYKVKMQHNLEDEEIYKFGTQGDEPVAEDVSQCRVTFEEASHATQLNSGSTLSTLFGLVKKWLNDLVDRINGKQDTLTFDSTPTQNSTNPVESNGIYAGLNSKQDKLTAGENITIQNNVISSTGGGVSDYADLRHKPQINGVTLTGNKTTSDLNLNQIQEVTQSEYDAMEAGGTLDPNIAYFINDADPDPIIPEGGSEGDYLESDGNGGLQWNNPVSELGTAAYRESTDRLIPDSTALPESRCVYNAIQSSLSSLFTPKGNIDFADLTSALLIPANVGNVYETNDAGVTDSNWIQTPGTTVPANSVVGIVSADVIRFNYMGASVFNLSDYQKKDLTATTQGANTVEGALTNLASQKAEQSSLNTTNQNVSSLQTAVNGKEPALNYIDYNLSGFVIDSGSAGHYYKKIPITLPAGKSIKSWMWNGSWSEDVLCVITGYGSEFYILAYTASPKTMPANRAVRVYFN